MKDDIIRKFSEYVNDHPFAVLSTVNENNHPSGAAVYVGSDDVFALFFITKTETTKARNIRGNSSVALTFSDEMHQSTLQVSGTAKAVEDHAENDEAFRVLASIKHESEEYRLPLSKLTAGPYIVFKVAVEKAVLTEFAKGSQLGGVIRTEYPS